MMKRDGGAVVNPAFQYKRAVFIVNMTIDISSQDNAWTSLNMMQHDEKYATCMRSGVGSSAGAEVGVVNCCA